MIADAIPSFMKDEMQRLTITRIPVRPTGKSRLICKISIGARHRRTVNQSDRTSKDPAVLRHTVTDDALTNIA